MKFDLANVMYSFVDIAGSHRKKHLWYETQRVVNHSLFLATKNVTTTLAQANNISCSIIHWVCCHNKLIVVLNFFEFFNHKYAVIKDLGKSNKLLCLQTLNFHAQVSLHLAPNLKNGSKNFLRLKQVLRFRPTIPFSGPILTIKVGRGPIVIFSRQY